RAVPARIGDGQIEIGVDLLARGEIDLHRAAVLQHHAAAVVIQHELGVDQLAPVLEQPIDAVGVAALLVRRQRQDDVPVGLVALGAIAQQRRHHDRVAVLHVLRAAAVEVAVLLHEHERIDTPVLAQRFDDVEMTDQQHRAFATGALQARDEILLAPARPDDVHVLGGETSVEQPLRHGFGGWRRAQAGLGGLDLDELLEQVARELMRILVLRGRSRRCDSASGNGRGKSFGHFSPSFSRSCGAVSSSVYTFEPTSNSRARSSPPTTTGSKPASRTRRSATLSASASSLASGIAQRPLARLASSARLPALIALNARTSRTPGKYSFEV